MTDQGAPPRVSDQPASAGTPPGVSLGTGKPPRRPIEVKRPGAIQERNPVVVILLSMFTCGIYYLYWLYVTDRELAEALDDPEIRPGMDLFLTIITCGIWSVYVEYRNAERVHAALLSRDPLAKDQSQTILICDVAAFFVGATWLVATYLLQEEFNKLARL